MKALTFIISGAAIAVVMLAGLLTFVVQYATANVTSSVPSMSERQEQYTFFATSTSQTSFATTTSATSTEINAWFDSNGRKDNGYFVVQGAEKVTFEFSRGDTSGEGNTGQTEFEVEYSQNGSDWFDYSRLIQDDLSGTATSSYTMTGTTTAHVSLDMTHHSIYAVRCIAIETTDGEHSCKAQADF